VLDDDAIGISEEVDRAAVDITEHLLLPNRTRQSFDTDASVER
jgi:hypothetical protein